jgi:hypothetical protein
MWYNIKGGINMSRIDELVEGNTKSELLAEAADLDLEVSDSLTKREIAEAIVRFETGVSDDVAIEDPKPVEKKAVDPADLQLVLFTGKNPVFQVGEYTFTRENPFLALPSNTAAHAYSTWPKKFRPATPQEARDFYA